MFTILKKSILKNKAHKVKMTTKLSKAKINSDVDLCELVLGQYI